MKLTLKISNILLFAFSSFPFASTAQDSIIINRHAFTAEEAVFYASKNNVQVKNALLDIQIQEQTNREITSAAYPSLNGNISTIYNPNVAVQRFPNFIGQGTYMVLAQEDVRRGNGTAISIPNDFGFIEAQFGTKWMANTGLDLNQILFDGQVFVGLQARKTSIDFQKMNAEVTEEIVKANIYKVYYQLTASRTQIELLDANLERLNKLLSDTRIIYENGFAERLDIDKLSVQISNLQTEKVKALNSISNGYLGLKLLMGMPTSDTLILTDTLTDETIKEGMLENQVNAYESRKEFQLAELGIKLNEFNIRRYKLSKLPTVSLGASYYKNAQRNKFDFLDGPYFTVSSVALRINVPIFNGFSTRAKVKRAELELEQSINQLEGLKISIDNEVETAVTNFRSAIATMDFQKENMELAERVYEQTRIKYEAGLGSNTEINAAQIDLKTAQTNFISALYDAIIARVDFLKATGNL
ncbi:MAG: TolC family protein [Chitinophagaceae bacterium]|jgi:outer membrane protein TolC|nr:TolC family protein [Chitinophagaceae bacterium]